MPPSREPVVQGGLSKKIHIDFDRLSLAGFVTPDSPRSAVADQYRVIKRPLLDNAVGKGAAPVKNGNLIMVTSSLSGEGKSFSAINLALSMALEVDYTVMLVDADVARPSIMKMLGLPQSPGLLDLLVDDQMDMSQVLLRTNVGNLTLLPSGSPRAGVTELLASTAMTELVEGIGKRYPDRIIIFDSPPLLLTTEARVLATHMGQIVMVVQAEKTLQSQVKHALATIEACPVKLMVLNQARSNNQDIYGYGYGYGYGQGYNQSEGAENGQPEPDEPSPGDKA
jgi:protein-tyrosine kinase